MPAETHSQRERSSEITRAIIFEQVAELLNIAPEDVTEKTPLPEDATAVVELIDVTCEELAERALAFETVEIRDWEIAGDVVEAFERELGAR